MADHSKPTSESLAANFADEIDARIDDITLGLDPATTTPTNLPVGAKAWSSAAKNWKKWTGTAWEDLEGTYAIAISGNAGSATKLATARTVTLNGDVSGSALFDGSSNLTITVTVADDSHAHVISNVDGLDAALYAKLDDSDATVTPTASKIPVASEDGTIDAGWLPQSGVTAGTYTSVTVDATGRVTAGAHADYSIGVPGTIGFGVAPCPDHILPEGFVALYGHVDSTHVNYGNYQFRDGSILPCVPKFFYRINHEDNPTHALYAPNDIHIVGTETFPNEAAANLAGYALHRAFIDGGIEQPCFFVDKYLCSKNALGTGFVASSIKNGAPLSVASDHNPITGLTACSTLAYWSALDAAKARDGANGAKNSSSRFFCNSRFIWGALAMLSLAHAQAATSAASCAWFLAGKNYPKGCNNNALRDSDDATVLYSSDGFQNCALTGSGVPFGKTTHNGQACGVCDLNGVLWEINIGMTCIATSKIITGVTLENPCVLTVVGHGRTTGDIVVVAAVGGTTQLNDKVYTITVVDSDRISLDGVNATGYTAYTSGGTITTGTFHAAKRATAMKDFTAGNTLGTDHWGATGVAAMMEPVALPLLAAPGGTSVALRFGNGVNQVLSADASGSGHTLAGLCAPCSTGAVSTNGAALFGADYFYQYVRNELCVVSGGYWSNGAIAGVCALNLNYSRALAFYNVGFRCACYPG